jgi:hypothetical protein
VKDNLLTLIPAIYFLTGISLVIYCAVKIMNLIAELALV